ncbi:MAG: hypothetical protein IM638_04650 [Bacteroidetes bacterium]|nr:hypothetical protein [Bacteroidota bacterium]
MPTLPVEEIFILSAPLVWKIRSNPFVEPNRCVGEGANPVNAFPLNDQSCPFTSAASNSMPPIANEAIFVCVFFSMSLMFI